MLSWEIKEFSGLSPSILYSILKLRAAVFVVEQTCAYLDPDGRDQQSLHVYGHDNGEVMAYARIVHPGVAYSTPAIGRVVTSPSIRRNGSGKELMKRAIESCRQHFPGQDITISAQCYLERFYNDLGFETISEPYPEDDIPHVKMILRSK